MQTLNCSRASELIFVLSNLQQENNIGINDRKL